MASVNAFMPEHPRWIKDENGEFYIFVKYEHVYIARRLVNGNFEWGGVDKKEVKFKENNNSEFNVETIIPLNGYCIIEPTGNEECEEIEKKLKKIGLRMPEYVMKKNSVKYGIVKYVGKPNKEYWWNGKSARDTDDGCDIKIGDKIIMRRSADIPLEYEHHASLEGRKRFFRVQRRYITAIAV
jgi:hypothetical protein